MRVDSLEIEAFGAWKELRLIGLSAELTVVHIADAERRNSLVQFVQFVLYGRDAAELPELFFDGSSSAAVSGSMLVSTSDRSLRIGRTCDHSPNSQGSDRLTVTSSNGQSDSPAWLARILHHIDAQTFRREFILHGTDLEPDPSEVDSDCLSRRCYERAMFVPGDDQFGGQVRSLIDRTYGKNMAEQLDLQGSRQRLAELDERRRRQEESLQKLRQIDLLGKYTTWTALYGKLDQEVQRSQERIKSIRRRLQLIRLAQDRCAKRARLAEVEETIASANYVHHGEQPQQQPMRQCERNDARIAKCRQAIGKIRERRSQLRRQIRGFTFAAVHTVVSRIRSLAERANGQLENEANLAELEARISRLQKDQPDSLQQDQQGDRNVPASSDQSAREVWKALQPFADRLRSAGKRLRQIRADSTQPGEAIHSSEARERDGSDGSLDALDEAIRQTNGRVNELRHRGQLDEHIQQLKTSHEMLQSECQQLLREQSLPLWVLGLMGLIFSGGIGAILAGIILAEDGMNWWLVLTGITVSFAVGLILLSFGRMANDRFASSSRQRHIVSTQLDLSYSELKTLDRRLGIVDQSPAEILERAEQELAALQKRAAGSKPATTAPSGDSLRQRVADARKEYVAARRQWSDALVARELPAGLTPRDVQALRTARSTDPSHARPAFHVHGQLETIDQLRRQWQAQSEDLAMWTANCRQVFEELGVDVAGNCVREIASQLRDTIAEHRQLQRRRRELVRRHSLLRQRGNKLRRMHKQLNAARQDSSNGSQTRDDAAPGVANASGDGSETPRNGHESLIYERDMLQSQIEAISERVKSKTRRTSFLQNSSDELQVMRRRYLTRLAAQHERRDRALEKHGRCRERLKLMTEDRRPAELQLELHQTLQRVRQESIQFQTASLGQSFLEQSAVTQLIRARWNENLDYAASCLVELTEGELTRIRADHSQRRIQVQRAQDGWQLIDELTPQQRASVCLCLRLARIRELAAEGMKLPLVIDNVLPASDQHRASRMSSLLCDFSRQGHQVILFTSSRQLASLFLPRQVPVAHIEENQVGSHQLVWYGGSQETSRKRPLPTEIAEPRSTSRLPVAPPADAPPYQVVGPIKTDRAHEEVRRIYLATLPTGESTTVSSSGSSDQSTRSSTIAASRVSKTPVPSPKSSKDVRSAATSASSSDPPPPSVDPQEPPPPDASTDETPDWWPD